MLEPMTEQRLREAQEVAWNPAYRPTADFPEHVYRHDLFRDVVGEVERLRGSAGEWRSTLAALHHILAEHRIAMRIEPGRPGPPKLIADLMGWVATAVECETHGQRERAERAEDEAERLREQLAEATTLLGHFVDHEDRPCCFDHHGACQEHGGSSLRRCDVAAGQELLAWVRGGDDETKQEVIMTDTITQAAAVPRIFHLQRDLDVTGVSGSGRVADGVLWPDGTVTVRWRGNMPSTAMWGSLEHAQAVHGHGGATRIVFDDEVTVPEKDLRAALRKVARMINDGLTESAAQGQRIVVLIGRAENIRDFCFAAANGGE